MPASHAAGISPLFVVLRLVATTTVSFLLVGCGSSALAETRAGIFAGTGAGTDMVRTVVRFESERAKTNPLWPAYWQFGVGYWRVPEFTGSRSDLYEASFSQIYRFARPLYGSTAWYVEAGLGAHLLSRTVNNYHATLPTAFQFGSHIGAGLAFGPQRQFELGIAAQHLSNARIKQPNRGINFVQVFVSWRIAD
jgi:lipid A 3-O-deacylase